MAFHIHKPHFTHQQVVRIAWSIIVMVLVSEAFCAFRCWSEHDVVTAWLVIAAWFREGFSVLLEKAGEAVAETL